MDDARRDVALKSTLDPDKVIKTFRLNKPKLVYSWSHDLPLNLSIVFRMKQEYQLLYFTMGDPLSDQEQNDRKVVLAEC